MHHAPQKTSSPTPCGIDRAQTIAHLEALLNSGRARDEAAVSDQKKIFVNTRMPSSSAIITMSSREIAELTGKLHKNVLADIRNTLDALGLDWADFLAQYIDSTGRALPCFSLPRREVEILLTGYSIPLRAKVIDRLHELEAAVARPAIPTSFAEALRLAATLEEEKLALVETVNVMRPHAQVGAAAGQRKRLGVVEFARKLTGVNTQQVQNDLQVMGYLYKRNGHWAVYSKFKGVLFGEVLDNKGRSSVVVLAKGQQLLAALYFAGRLTMKAGCDPVDMAELE